MEYLFWQWLPNSSDNNSDSATPILALPEGTPQDGPPKTLKEFNVRWKKSKGDANARYDILRSMPSGCLNEVFKTELDSDTLCEIVHAFAQHGFAGSEGDVSHAVEFLEKVCVCVCVCVCE
jgi:hypothetical protein